jgi:hypothetical protein
MKDERASPVPDRRVVRRRESAKPGVKDNLVLLHSTLSNLSKKRGEAPPRIPEPAPGILGATAITATLMGMGSQAQAMINATGESDWRSEADWVEFEMEGNHFKGVLWMMPIRRGEKVKVVAEQTGENRYVAYAVQRESDAVVAIYPNAVMGRKARERHEWRGTLEFFAFIQVGMLILMGLMAVSKGDSLTDTLILLGMMFPATAIVMLTVYFLGKWKYRNSIEDGLAESIFAAFGWPDPQNFNLQKVSRWPTREQLRGDIPSSPPDSYFRLRYFRYEASSQT